MEYTTKSLSKLSGVTSRTIRYYDEVGILKPKRISSKGYRIYGHEEVIILQQILFYKDMGLSISEIKNILNNKTTDILQFLKKHKENLENEKNRIDVLIQNINLTIKEREEGSKMKDNERFMGFKKRMIEENEKVFGKEAREKYGDEAVDKVNAQIMNMSEEDFLKLSQIEEELFKNLSLALKENDPKGEYGKKAAQLHKKWLSIQWGSYDKEKHYYLTKMYLEDERFINYYDKIGKGATKMLKDAVGYYTNMES